MTKIICPSIECKYCSDNHICTAKEVKLTYKNTLTVHEGRVNMWVCNKFEENENETVKEFRNYLNECRDNWLNDK